MFRCDGIIQPKQAIKPIQGLARILGNGKFVNYAFYK